MSRALRLDRPARAGSPRVLSLRERLVRSWDVLLELMSSTGQGMGSTWKGAEISRLRPGWGGGSRAPDQEIQFDLMLLRSRARALRRNSPYIEHYVNLLLTNVLGATGPEHQAQVLNAAGELDEPINDRIEAAWREWAEGPVTADGTMNLTAFRDLQLETMAIDGESFTNPLMGAEFRHGLALQPIDPDLVDEKMSHAGGRDTPEVRMGVEVDRLGRRLGYHIWDRPEYGPGSANRGRVRYEASEILHHFRPRRAHQTRGVTWLAAAMTDLMDLDGYDEAVIVGARAAANQMGFIEWTDPAAGGPSEDRTPVERELNPGTTTELDPGQKFTGFTPEQPTAVYSPFVKTRLRRISGALGVAYEALANDRESVNYGSMRGGSLIERDLWKKRHEMWRMTFELPVRMRWLQTALLSGALQLPGADWHAYAASKVVFRGWPWVDPKKDAETSEIELALGLTSRQRIHAQRGSVFSEVLAEQAQERDLAAKLDLDIEPRRAAATPATPPDDGEEDPDDEAGDGANGGARGRSNRIAAAIAARRR